MLDRTGVGMVTVEMNLDPMGGLVIAEEVVVKERQGRLVSR